MFKKNGLEVKFTTELLSTKDPEIFLGVARVLKVPLMVDKDTPKGFDRVVDEVIEAYCAAPQKRKKELYKILKDANSCKEKVSYGNSTKDTAKAIPNKEV